jgi:hypothetical protein
MPVIPALRRSKDHEFEASLDNMARLCLKKQNNNNKLEIASVD